jgi:hypothetical protein
MSEMNKMRDSITVEEATKLYGKPPIIRSREYENEMWVNKSDLEAILSYMASMDIDPAARSVLIQLRRGFAGHG